MKWSVHTMSPKIELQAIIDIDRVAKKMIVSLRRGVPCSWEEMPIKSYSNYLVIDTYGEFHIDPYVDEVKLNDFHHILWVLEHSKRSMHIIFGRDTIDEFVVNNVGLMIQ